MALRLRVISDHRHRLGDKSTFVFGVSGGSIGRSAENDWVLPDDMRYVSGRHARIVFHKGRYLLQDTSSNGTFVNDIDRPLGNQNPHELKSGDVDPHRRIPRAGADRLRHRFQPRRQRAVQDRLDEHSQPSRGATEGSRRFAAPRESARSQQRHLERRAQTRQRIRPGRLGAHARAASDAGSARKSLRPLPRSTSTRKPWRAASRASPRPRPNNSRQLVSSRRRP